MHEWMGIALEKYYARLLDELGRLNVQHSITLSNRTRNGTSRSQIDVKEGWPIPRYHECKYRQEGNVVSLEEVAKFAGVLTNHGISPKRGAVVTNRHLDVRAKDYAHNIGLGIIEREGLVRLDWQRTYQFRSLVQQPTKRFDDELEQRIKKQYHA